MRKEIIICKDLKDWFELFGLSCWLNEGTHKFKTKLSQKKPDLLIYSNSINQYIAIEVKTGDTSRDLYDASKIIEYWEDYENQKIKYFINEEEIKINSFAIATAFSKFGKLFKDDDNAISIEECKNDSWKFYCKKTGLEPLWEYSRSSDYLRSLWSQWRKKRVRKKQAGIGVILSNALNEKELVNKISRPLLFDMQWEEQTNKHKWQNRQKVL